MNQTGNKKRLELTKWEGKVVDFLEKQRSNIIRGVPQGLESTDTDVSGYVNAAK